MLEFNPLALSLRGKYSDYFYAAQERASDYSFINLWAWNDERRYETAFYEGLYWIRLTKSEPFEMWSPVGDWSNKDWKSILKRLFPEGAVFKRVPDKLTSILQEQLGGMIEVSGQRPEWEYLYSAKELIDLSGNRFHRKKNLLYQFLKYNPVYEEINSENIEEIIIFQSEWCKHKNYDRFNGLMAESIATIRVLSDWEKLRGIMGGALRIDGKIVAYVIAEDLGDGTVIIHFEKGFYFDKYKGVYQGINQIFLKNSKEFILVNREQDMGIEGLRQAKMTYNPTGFIKKHIVKWKI